MNLNNFENHIAKKILARGFDYYEYDSVRSVEEIDGNQFEAEVEGTELYTVEVELDDNENIIDSQCDCPYDLGEYCKHQVAVFFALRDMRSNISSGDNMLTPKSMNGDEVSKSPVAKKRRAPDLEKMLLGQTKEELVKLLLEIASEHEEIKQRIKLNFDCGNDEDELVRAIKLIRTFISNHSDKHGFVAYGHTGEAVHGGYLVLDKARLAHRQNKPMHAIELALCVTHEMIDLLEGADDSDGDIGGVIEESFSFISEVIDDDEELILVERESVFNRLLEESTHSCYKDWEDWRLDLLEKCSELADTSSLRNTLDKHLLALIEKSQKKDSWSSNYLVERVNIIRYHLIVNNDEQKKAQEFLDQNLQYSNFRKMAIEMELKKKEYKRVIELTLEGEKKDKDLRGLVVQWKKYRYQAYKLSERLEEQRGTALEFILDGSAEYYHELKSTYSPHEWLSEYPKIIFLLENQKKTQQNVYRDILIEEGEKEKLLEYVKGNLSSVVTYYKYLIPDFWEEVYEVFRQYIVHTAARAGNRRDYQGVCAIIRNLKKAGGKEQALEIKQILLDKYPNRPAFRDELSRV